jgi:glycosyltransferase involved in cell wall biosynthesis
MTRIAYLSYSSGEFDGRTQRMARSAIEAGYDVVVYARWQKGLPHEEAGPGYRIVRIPAVPDLVLPWRRRRGRRRLAEILAHAPASLGSDPAGAGGGDDQCTATIAPSVPPSPTRPSLAALPRRALWRLARSARRAGRWLRNPPWMQPIMLFPLRPLGWAIPLEELTEPADIWHGMWAGSLPALGRLRARHGGKTIYDSRDVYMRSRGFERLGPFKAPFAWLERRWAHQADAVLTVNDAYADLLAEQLGVPRPAVVRNTPNRYVRPEPPPDLIRERLGLAPDTRVVLYQGGLMSDRGIEQGMDAILSVPNAIFAILGFGNRRDEIVARGTSAPYRDRVRFLDPVTPDELLDWTASADVMLMAIQPTSTNHEFTTPQKLWEAIAAGVPVVASDLPGMAEIVRELDCGVLVDATDPADIARGILAILDAPAEDRAAMRDRAWRGGQDRYNWESQLDALFGLYRNLAEASPAGPSARRVAR